MPTITPIAIPIIPMIPTITPTIIQILHLSVPMIPTIISTIILMICIIPRTVIPTSICFPRFILCWCSLFRLFVFYKHLLNTQALLGLMLRSRAPHLGRQGPEATKEPSEEGGAGFK